VSGAGWEVFVRYAFPPNELGYCGPPDSSALLRPDAHADATAHAAAFDGAWPYLEEIAAAVGAGDPLDAAVVRAYWIGGPQLAAVEPAKLARRLRTALAGQPTGVLDKVGTVLAHHSFHVFAVYPWVRFLEVDPSTSLRILQACRVRWGLVQTVVDEHVVMASRPLVLDGGVLRLGDAGVEAVRWRRGGISLAPAPSPGQTVAAHWDWVCGSLDADEVAALAEATATTLETVNSARRVKTHAGGDA